MFVILLHFAESRERAGELMDGHRAWIRRNLQDGTFVLVGGLADNGGGAILAQGATREGITEIIAQDPFVAEAVVRPEIHEFMPSLADERLAFLLS